jgi:hypothetical protein
MRTKACDAETRAGRMRKAESFLELAEIASLEERHADSAVTLHVLAGIAAADVVCCARLGKHAQGENHGDAVALLAEVDTGLASDLRTLLAIKSKASYGHDSVSKKETARAVRAAQRLVEAAQSV